MPSRSPNRYGPLAHSDPTRRCTGITWRPRPTATFNNATITGAENGAGIGYIDARDTATLNVNFNNSTITTGTGEGIGLLRARENGTVNASFVNNTITAPSADAVDADTVDSGTLNTDFQNNTLTSGGGFFDFNLNQTGASQFNVVDLPNLSGNTNGGNSFP